jgi:hypothetical protein
VGFKFEIVDWQSLSTSGFCESNCRHHFSNWDEVHGTEVKRLFEKSKLIPALAIRNRAPLATSRETRPKQWLGYTDTTRLRRFQILDFVLLQVGGLCLCSSELYSPKTFQTSSKAEIMKSDESPKA